MRCIIRVAQPSDVSAIQTCADAAYQPYIERMNKKPAPMVANFDNQVAKGIVSVAMQHSELVGYVVYYPVANIMHLENVAVVPRHAGAGVGKRLIRHVENQAAANGFTCVELYTNELMHENLAMYPKLGYVETERKTQSGFNRVFFSKTVSPEN